MQCLFSFTLYKTKGKESSYGNLQRIPTRYVIVWQDVRFLFHNIENYISQSLHIHDFMLQACKLASSNEGLKVGYVLLHFNVSFWLAPLLGNDMKRSPVHALFLLIMYVKRAKQTIKINKQQLINSVQLTKIIWLTKTVVCIQHYQLYWLVMLHYLDYIISVPQSCFLLTLNFSSSYRFRKRICVSRTNWAAWLITCSSYMLINCSYFISSYPKEKKERRK